jgi:hypothetical protein
MTTVSFVAGVLCGWAVRSAVDSPHDLGIKALDAVYKTRARLGRWVAIERERIEDLMAEVRQRYEPLSALTSRGTLSKRDTLDGSDT